MKEDHLCEYQDVIQYQFTNVALLVEALTHSSAAATRLESNERLEFLGDAVLGMVICETIHDSNPELAEGDMTKIKSVVVSRVSCAQVADQLGLPGMLLLGKGVSSARNLPPSLSAAVLESVIGAIYIDGGLAPARDFILREMGSELTRAMASQHHRNYKSVMQQYAQREWNTTPEYELLDEKGPEHAKCFEVAVRVGSRQFPSAWGNYKKQAEQKAARAALDELGMLAGLDTDELDTDDLDDRGELDDES